MPKPKPPLIPLTDTQRDRAAAYFDMALRIGDEAARRYPGLSDEVRCAAVDGLLKAVRKFDPSIARLSTWVDHVCWQAVLTELKHWRDSPFERHREAEVYSFTDPTSEPKASAKTLEFLISDALAVLPRYDAELFRLHVLEGWSYRKLIQRQGVSNKSLVRILRESRAILRQHSVLTEYVRKIYPERSA